MAEHDVDRPDRLLQLFRHAKQRRHVGQMYAIAGFQRVGVIAHDMEHPEDQRRSAHMLRHLAMARADERQDALQHRARAHVFGAQGLGFDEAEHQGAGCLMQQFGRQTAGRGGPAGGALVEAHHAVDRDILAHAHEIALARILDQEVGVGDAALDRLWLDLAPPARQRSRHVDCRHRLSPLLKPGAILACRADPDNVAASARWRSASGGSWG